VSVPIVCVCEFQIIKFNFNFYFGKTANHLSVAIYKRDYGNMAQWPQHIYTKT